MGKRIVPYGNRILCRRRPVGEKIGQGILVLTDEMKERPTDIADVVYVPEHSFADKELISNAESIIKSLAEKAKNGDSESLKGLLEFNFYLKIKSLQPGDVIFISKYVGTDFHTTEDSRMMTVVSTEDIMGVICNE